MSELSTWRASTLDRWQDDVIDILTSALLGFALLLLAGALLWNRRWATALGVAGLLLALTALAIGVHTNGWVMALDAPTASWMGGHRSHSLDIASLMIARIGSPAATAAAGLIGAAMLSWRDRSLIPGVIVVTTVGAAALVETVIKEVVDRPLNHAASQEVPLMSSEHHSFPSGHVAGTAALLGIVAVYLGAGRSRTVRALLAVLVVVGVLIVAFTRLYLGVHRMIDVVGGALLAAILVIFGASAFLRTAAGNRRSLLTPRVAGQNRPVECRRSPR